MKVRLFKRLFLSHLTLVKKSSVFTFILLLSSAVFSNPTLDNVASGNATVTQNGGNTVVNQSSQQTIINWRDFNIGANESTHFQQPAGGIALNRINPNSGPSSIYGRLTATGQIILINPAGVYFGPSAYVNVGGLIATTANITDQDFLNGHYQFSKVNGYSGSVINEGQIIAQQNGLVALVAPSVINRGLIQANMGRVVLASGEAFTMNFAGSELINFTVDQGASGSGRGVTSTGSLIADGGQILVTAKAAQGVLDNVINLEGVVQARSVGTRNGEIILSGDKNGGMVRVASKVDASGKGAGQKGGNVTVTGYNILLDQGASIDTSGDLGGGDIRVGGNYLGKGPLPNANAVVMAPTVALNADALTNGDGGEVILWSDTLTKAYGNISTRGGALGGNGGFIETSSKGVLDVAGIKVDTRAPNGTLGTWLLDPYNVTITTGATSNGSFNAANPNVFTPSGTGSNVNNTDIQNNLATANVTITTTGAGAEAGNITVDAPITWGSSNTLFLQADNNIIINAAITGLSGTLQLQAANAAQSITTGAGGAINVANFTLSQGNWYQVNSTLPAFNVTNNFRFSGLLNGNTFVRALSGDGSSGNPYSLTDIYGLQGIVNQMSGHFTLANNIDASVTSNWDLGDGVTIGFAPIANYTGGSDFLGSLNGNGFTVSNLFMDQTGVGNSAYGMFFSLGNASTISNLNITNADVSGNTLGGIIAGSMNSGATINNVNVSGSITGVIFGGIDADYVGGLVGLVYSGGTISNSSANVTLTAAGTSLGGLAGYNEGTISNSYATGSVASTDNSPTVPPGVGGLVGVNFTGGVINSSYANVAVTGGQAVGGFVGANNGTINNAFSLGSVSLLASGTNTRFGGFVGNNIGGTINNAFSTAYVNVTAGGGVTNVGGFGGAGNAANNSFWNTDTSGQSTDVIGGATAGCFSGTCSNGGTVNMSDAATYTGAGWDFSSTWNIIQGGSYPYLRAINTTAPRVMTGTAAGITPGSGVSVAANGVVAGTFYVAANNTYYIFLPNSAIADNGAALIYYNGATKGNLLVHAPTTGSALSGLAITDGQLTIGTSATDTYTSADLVSAVGSTVNSDIFYTTSGSNVTVANNIDLVTTGTTTFNVGGNITASGTGGLTFANLGVTADSILTAPTVDVTGTITGSGTQNLTIANTGTSTLSGIISNLASLVKNGAGTLVLSAANTLSGTTNINAGTVQLDGSLANSGVVLAGSGILDLNGVSKTIASLSGTGGTVSMGAGTLTFGDSNTTSYSGAITGTGGVNKQGSGNATLSGTNTYSGATAVNAGTLTAASAQALGTTAGGTSVASGATLAISGVAVGSEAVTLNGGTLTGSGTSSLGGAVTLGAASAINSTGTFTLSGNINGGNDLTFGGSGALVIAGLVGNSTAVNSITSNATTLNLNGGALTSVGSQTYNGGVALGGATTLTAQGNGSSYGINFANGVSGGQNLIVNGGSSGNFAFTLGGTLALNNVTVNGNASTSNTVNVSTSGAQTYTFSGTNTASIAATGIAGAFATTDVQNYGGGNNGNTFIFNDGATLTGSINGGSLASTNTIDYSAYTTPVTIALTTTNNGTTTNSLSSVVNAFTNINNVNNNTLDNTLILPNKTTTLVINSEGAGYVNDPLNFNGIYTYRSLAGDTVTFNVTPSSIVTSGNTTTVVINGVTMTFIGFNFNTGGDGGGSGSSTTQNEVVTANEQGSNPSTGSPATNNYSGYVAGNIDQLMDDMALAFDRDIRTVKINPYCYANDKDDKDKVSE